MIIFLLNYLEKQEFMGFFFLSLFWEDWQHLFRIKQRFYLDLFTVIYRDYMSRQSVTLKTLFTAKNTARFYIAKNLFLVQLNFWKSNHD